MPDDSPHRPRWVPYSPPDPSGWDRLWSGLRRLGFPLVALAMLAAIGALLYIKPAVLVPAAPEEAGMVAPVVLQSEGEEGPGGVSALTVRSRPAGASIWLNGDSLGTAPLTNHPVEAGVYLLSVRAPDHFSADTVAVLMGDTTPTLQFRLRPRPGTEAAASNDEAPPAQAPSRPAPKLTRTPPPAPAQQTPTPRPSTGTLVVGGTPAGATVTIDGRLRGQTPLTLSQVEAGERTVLIELDGYTAWQERIRIQPNATSRIAPDLVPKMGRLRVLARPWGTIYINGDLHAREQDVWYETDLPVGTHQVTVVHPVLGKQVREVMVDARNEQAVVVDLQATSESPQ